MKAEEEAVGNERGEAQRGKKERRNNRRKTNRITRKDRTELR
jgi:hypothetical protein